VSRALSVSVLRWDRRQRGAAVLPLKLAEGIPLTLADGHDQGARTRTGSAMAIAELRSAYHGAMAIAA
jgi:hypothetical protein